MWRTNDSSLYCHWSFSRPSSQYTLVLFGAINVRIAVIKEKSKRSNNRRKPNRRGAITTGPGFNYKNPGLFLWGLLQNKQPFRSAQNGYSIKREVSYCRIFILSFIICHDLSFVGLSTCSLLDMYLIFVSPRKA